jgi:hypothetical protein
MPEVAHALILTLNDNNATRRHDLGVRGHLQRPGPDLATLLRMANSAMFGLSRSVKHR